MPKFTKYERAHILFRTFLLLVKELCAFEKLEHKYRRRRGEKKELKS